jgi:hypothetical protein
VIVRSFQEITEVKIDEITTQKVLYLRPYAERIRYQDVKALFEAVQESPRPLTPGWIW